MNLGFANRAISRTVLTVRISIVGFGLLFFLTGAVCLVIAVYDPLWGWVDEHSGSGCTYTVGKCSDDVVLTMSITGAIFASVGILVTVVGFWIASQAGRIATGGLSLFGRQAAANNTDPAAPGNASTASTDSPQLEQTRSLLRPFGITIPDGAVVIATPAQAVQPGPGPPRDPTSFQAPAVDEAGIRATGIAASAVLKGVSDTGVVVAGRALVELELTVRIDGRAPYDTSCYAAVPLAVVPALASGAIVPVKVSQADPRIVVADWNFD